MTSGVYVALGVVLVALYITWTAGRLDRMHARVDAAWFALDAQLVRRAAAVRQLLGHLPVDAVSRLVDERSTVALHAGEANRDVVENALTRAVRAAVPSLAAQEAAQGLLAELDTAMEKVALARSFHNNAVAGARELRRRRLPRLLRLAGRRALPTYFDVDDTAFQPRADQRPA